MVGTGTTLQLTERFRRVDEETLLYEFTVTDPTSFTRPFSAALPMKRGTTIRLRIQGFQGDLILILGGGARQRIRQAILSTRTFGRSGKT